MALSGLAIYKLLPKTNCKECGYPTCLAFAMKLAAKQAELADCPHVSEEAKQALEESSAPPIRLVKIGEGDRALEVGNETVMFRHEKTFVHPPGLFVRLRDSASPEELEQRAREIASYSVERVGLDLSLTGVAVEATSDDAGRFAAAVEAVHRGAGEAPMVLISRDAEVLKAGAERAGSRPLLWGADQGNWQEVAAVAKAVGAPVVAIAEGDLSALAEVTQNLKGAGIEDIVLDPRPSGPAEALRLFTGIRRLALRQNFRDLGYPILATVDGESDPNRQAILAAQHVAKYGSVIILEEFDPAVAYILLTLRLNIYTDPQKPIQVSPGLYEIGTPQAESPLLVTTNFSLTYFSVSGEVEASGAPAWLLVADAEGLSVLTAWAAGKFDAETIAKAVKQFGAESKTAHRKIILPGFVASLSGELEDELPGWDVLVGPREAVDIPAYLRNWH